MTFNFPLETCVPSPLAPSCFGDIRMARRFISKLLIDIIDTEQSVHDAILKSISPDVQALVDASLAKQMPGIIVALGAHFLPTAGGFLSGPLDMSHNPINNLAPSPVLPNGAAPASWVLSQIASVNLYQGTWNAATNTPDLTQSSTHQNGFTWIVLNSPSGPVVVSQAIPGLQGETVDTGDTVIWSTVEDQFSLIPGTGVADFLPLSGGTMMGPLTLSANAAAALQAVPYQQLQSYVATEVAGYLPLTGGALTGPGNLSVGDTLTINTGGLAADFQMYRNPGAGTRVLQWAGNGIVDALQEANLYRVWIGPGGTTVIMSLAPNGALNATGTVSAGATGVIYQSYATNAVAFVWNGSQIFVYLDGTSQGALSLVPSDTRSKTNMVAASEDALATLSQVTLYAYDLSNPVNPETSPRHFSVGFSAQQLQTLIPEAVAVAPDAEHSLSIDTSPLVARCVGAIQQLAARVAALDGKTA